MVKLTNLGAALLAAGFFGSGCGSNLETSIEPEPIPDELSPTPITTSHTPTHTYKWGFEPFLGVKYPMQTYMDVGNYQVFGVKITRTRGRKGLYLRGESGGADERLPGPGDSYADIEDTRHEIGFGGELTVADGKRVKITLSAGPKIVLSEMKGIVSDFGSKTEFRGKSEMYMAEANARLSFKLSKRARLTGEFRIERDLVDDMGLDYESYTTISFGAEF